MDIKHLCHLHEDVYVAFPKWDKRVKKVAIIGAYGYYKKGVSSYKEVEFTQGVVPLPDPQPKSKPQALWRLGKAGKEIFLTDYLSEKSFTIHKGSDFNYQCQLQVVRKGEAGENKYKVFWVGFSQETCGDVLYEADLCLNYFDKRFIMPNYINFTGDDYNLKKITELQLGTYKAGKSDLDLDSPKSQ